MANGLFLLNVRNTLRLYHTCVHACPIYYSIKASQINNFAYEIVESTISRKQSPRQTKTKANNDCAKLKIGIVFRWSQNGDVDGHCLPSRVDACRTHKACNLAQRIPTVHFQKNRRPATWETIHPCQVCVCGFQILVYRLADASDGGVASHPAFADAVASFIHRRGIVPSQHRSLEQPTCCFALPTSFSWCSAVQQATSVGWRRHHSTSFDDIELQYRVSQLVKWKV